jgi:hypothetical protein
MEAAVNDSPASAEQALRWVGVMGASALLSGCGGGASGSDASSSGNAFQFKRPASDQEAVRFLLQAQFSASDAEIASVKAMGYEPWLRAQLAAPAGQTGTAWLDSKGFNVVTANSRSYFSTGPADFMVWNQLMTSSDAPRRRMA